VIDVIPPIAAISAAPGIAPTPPTVVAPAATSDSASFGSLLAQGMEHLQGLQSNADTLAVQAATGDLQDIHDYTIAATEASVATELTVAIRNKAVEAFNEIMRMPM
jgi:flagellar hook-basal body complex protein FliE